MQNRLSVDEEQIEKWRKVKEALERANKTNSFIYKRAAAVVKSGKDPGDNPFILDKD